MLVPAGGRPAAPHRRELRVSDESGFSIVMRGYNRDEVDRAVLELRAAHDAAAGELAGTRRELRRDAA